MNEPAPVMPITEDGADLEFLTKLFPPPHCTFSLAIGQRLKDNYLHEAMVRAVLAGWIRLIDIEPIMTAGTPTVSRVFRREYSGEMRVRELRGKAS